MLGEKVLVQLSSDFIVGIVGLLTTILIARFLGPLALGTVGFILGILGIISFVGDLGFGTAHIKRISEGKKFRENLGTFIFIRFFQAILFLVIGFVFFFTSKFFAPNLISSKEEILVFFLLLITSFLVILSGIFISTFQGTQEAVKANFPQALGKIIKLLVTVVIIFGLANAVGIATTYLVEAVSILFFFLLLFRKIPFSAPKLIIFKSYLAYAFPLIIVNSLSYFFGNVDKLVIKSFWSNEVVGWYFAMQSLIALPQTLSSSVMTMFFPNISSLFAQKRFDEIRKKCQFSLRYLLMITIPFSTTFIFFRQDLVRLFLGESFVPGADILIPLSILVVIIAIVRPYSNILYAIEKHRILVKVNLINLFVLVSLNLLLVPRELFGVPLFGLGGVGAAVANIAIWVISGTTQIYIIRKNLKIPFFSNIFYYLISGAFMYLAYLVMFNFDPFTSYIPKLISTVSFGLIVYFFILNLFRELSGNDLNYFLKIIKPKLLLKSAKKEIQS